MFFDLAVEMIDSSIPLLEADSPFRLSRESGNPGFCVCAPRPPHWMPVFAGMTDIFFA